MGRSQHSRHRLWIEITCFLYESLMFLRSDKSSIWLRTRTCPRHLVPDKSDVWRTVNRHTHLLTSSIRSRLPWHPSSCLSNRMERPTGEGAVFPFGRWSRGNHTVTQSSKALNTQPKSRTPRSHRLERKCERDTLCIVFLASADLATVSCYISPDGCRCFLLQKTQWWKSW